MKGEAEAIAERWDREWFDVKHALRPLRETLAMIAREAYAAGRKEAFGECKAADYLTEQLRDPEFRGVFLQEWERDKIAMDAEVDEQKRILAVLDDRIASMRGGPRLAEAREIRAAIARRAGEGT